ncbi:hypothetical protein LTR85_002496 [Meristemomyces frigidus]|nr:hypothetical protein LTR85_002496 [Meristemomyces frigidus]
MEPRTLFGGPRSPRNGSKVDANAGIRPGASGPVPSGSGNPVHSAYRPFVDELSELVMLCRRERASRYNIRALERELGTLSQRLDEDRLEAQHSEVKSRRRRARDVERLEGRIPRLYDQVSAALARLRGMRSDNHQLWQAIQRGINKLYELQPAMVNDVFKPEKPRLSPLFHERLRRAKTGRELRDVDVEALRNADQRAVESHGSMMASTTVLTNCINGIELGDASARGNLADAMTELERQIRAHQALLAEQERVGARVEMRRRRQRYLESNLCLDIAAPILEAEGMLYPDRLRTSATDLDEDGEPVIFAVDEGQQLTDDQYEAIRQEARKAYLWVNSVTAMRNTLEQSYDLEYGRFRQRRPDADSVAFE